MVLYYKRSSVHHVCMANLNSQASQGPRPFDIFDTVASVDTYENNTCSELTLIRLSALHDAHRCCSTTRILSAPDKHKSTHTRTSGNLPAVYKFSSDSNGYTVQ